MHLSIELPSGVYLADIYTKAGGGELDHHFRIFHRHNDLHLAEVAEAVLELVKTKQFPPDYEFAKTSRIILVKDSLWATLRDHLQEMVDQEGVEPRAVHFTHSPLYGVLDHAELSITFMNLTNLPLSIETGLEGLLGGPTDGALVSLLSCLQMVRAWEGLEGGSAERFRAEMDKAIDAVKELSQAPVWEAAGRNLVGGRHRPATFIADGGSGTVTVQMADCWAENRSGGGKSKRA